ncbi:MAG: lysophospholipid acyltransferase family protein [Firmicutes bacterium]|nr:lysophospholipid acyltransferase family protein [Bacillota bacterium]
MTWLYRFGLAVVPGLFKLLYPYKILHRSPLPEGSRAIICSNHISMIDPILLAFTQKRQIYYMAKAELFHNRLLSWLIRSLGAFPVNRGKGDSAAVNTAVELLNEDKLLGIFIEGTRSRDGNLLKPKPGTVMFAAQTGAPIIPVAIAAKGGKMRLFHKVVISCGEPIPPEELNIREGTGLEYRNASRYVMSRISELREEAIAALNQKKKK